MRVPAATLKLLIAVFGVTACAAPFFLGSAHAGEVRPWPHAESRNRRPAWGPSTDSQESSGATRKRDSCADCHRSNNDETVVLFGRSTHFRRSISCSNCHGGTTSATVKSEAHQGSFVSRPDPPQILAMCGSCHSSQLTTFKASRHYVSSKGTPRVDCAQCHGAHTVGAQAASFSMAYFCAGCHGLEYLPSLPAQLREVLDQSDKVRDLVRSIDQSGSKLSDESVGLRRQVRRLTGEVVHATDLEGGGPKIAEIRKLNESLLLTLERDKSKGRRGN